MQTRSRKTLGRNTIIYLYNMEENVHDIESYIITIRRRNSPAQVQTVAAAPMPGSVVAAVSKKETVRTDKPSGAGTVVTAPLPGVIISVKVKPGDTVKAGQVVAILEAMKMENEIQTECDGIVTAVHVEQGESILEGATIATIE